MKQSFVRASAFLIVGAFTQLGQAKSHESEADYHEHNERALIIGGTPVASGHYPWFGIPSDGVGCGGSLIWEDSKYLYRARTRARLLRSWHVLPKHELAM